MTNEEIRNKQPLLANDNETTCLFESIEVDAIQNLTRADERDRVIEDIKETLTRLYVNDIDITDLYYAMIKELNSLKENK